MQSIKYFLLCLILIGIANCVSAQEVYTIKADSTKLTGCDSNELIIENHTQAVKGFLYNTGNGRTIFKKGVVKPNDSINIIGSDTIKVLPPTNFWGLKGNYNINPSLNGAGTMDAQPFRLLSGGFEQMRLSGTSGNVLIGTQTELHPTSYKLQVSGRTYLKSPDWTRIGNMVITTGVVGAAGIASGIQVADSNGNSPIVFANGGGATDMFVFDDTYGSGMNVFTNKSIVRVKPTFLNNNTDHTVNLMHLNPTYNIQNCCAQHALYIRGFYYNPTVTSLFDGSKQIAFEATQGDVLIGTGVAAKVGINKSNPAVELDMNGQATFNIPSGGGYAMVKQGTGSGGISGFKLLFTDSDGISNSFGVRIQGYKFSGSKITGLYVDNAPQFVFSGAEFITEQKHTFFAGVSSGIAKDLPILLAQNNSSSFTTGIKFYAANYNSNVSPVMSIMQDGTVGIGASAPTAQFHTTGTVRFAGLTNDNTQTRVVVSDANGNLFYRTLSTWTANDIPRSSLAVDGEIRAKSLRLKPEGWADYVFDSAYHLPALGDVRNFIRDHKHLPDVPSAAEIAKDGVDVGSNQAVLLRKIEELTLYTLDQDKKIEDLQRQVTELQNLKKEIESLKKMILTTTSK